MFEIRVVHSDGLLIGEGGAELLPVIGIRSDNIFDGKLALEMPPMRRCGPRATGSSWCLTGARRPNPVPNIEQSLVVHPYGDNHVLKQRMRLPPRPEQAPNMKLDWVSGLHKGRQVHLEPHEIVGLRSDRQQKTQSPRVYAAGIPEYKGRPLSGSATWHRDLWSH